MLTQTIEQKLFLVTRPSVQSHLLLEHLNQEINIPVVVLNVKKPMMFYSSEKSIFVYDTEAASNKSNKIWPKLLTESQSRMRICLLNCSRALSVYEKSVWHHFDTVVPDEATPDSLVKTIRNMVLNKLDERANGCHKMVPEQPFYGKSSGNLTEREYEILHELCKGESNARIASSFFISENTVRTHLYNIFKKISVTNRIQAVNWINNQMVS
ncbi:helix-turn-helix transcriptional regulator [Buttiauxella sp. B2]|uniref:LuxR C-terminal-related transcriptional regulator n=1 Tax=Buttiauxella sp. B2 TaxID=2587812 RepID=UPI00111EF9CA|nr:LuxR C-terminal-related transcriptional regulator [Buttiauxella sp. B2]TNV20454.1 helix-turn-helix transcriptional regulator [Buttiauxella sp. B2]